MTARRRPPKEPVPTETKSEPWTVVLEKLQAQAVVLEGQAVVLEQLQGQKVVLEGQAAVLKQLQGQSVVLEQVQGHLRVVSERALDTLTRRESLEIGARTADQIELLRDALRMTRSEVASRFDGVDKRLDGVEHEVRGVRQDVMRQAQGAELRALDQRMTVVERHLGI